MILACLPRHTAPHERPRAWSSPLRLGGKELALNIRTKVGTPTRLEIRRGAMLRASVEDSLYYDGSIHPFLWVRRNEAFLAYAAVPGTGSGLYASVWKIADGGRSVRQIGTLRYADLRAWRQGGVVREFRPTKYTTEDLFRVLPNVYDGGYTDKRFILGYRFDRRHGRFRFVGYRVVSDTFPWPETIRFPGR